MRDIWAGYPQEFPFQITHLASREYGDLIGSNTFLLVAENLGRYTQTVFPRPSPRHISRAHACHEGKKTNIQDGICLPVCDRLIDSSVVLSLFTEGILIIWMCLEYFVER